MLSLIAAVDKNRVLGSQGRLPWYLPADLRRFRTLTRHHALVMGRRTYESIGFPLPERLNVVLTRDPQRLRAHRGKPGLAVATTLEEALALATTARLPSGRPRSFSDRVFVVGGAHVYTQTLPLADEILLTEIDTEVEHGDAFFPEVPRPPFFLFAEEAHGPDQQNWTGYTYRTYYRGARTLDG